MIGPQQLPGTLHYSPPVILKVRLITDGDFRAASYSVEPTHIGFSQDFGAIFCRITVIQDPGQRWPTRILTGIIVGTYIEIAFFVVPGDIPMSGKM
jgi:hypothetical protein